jgi:broad specificity phosphatase PhoE
VPRLGLWLIRHGATTAPPDVATGSSDPPLSVTGLAQARAAAAALAGRPLTAVYSSDRRRATATADEIARIHRLPVFIDVRLRELDFGVWEGLPLADLWLVEPAAARAWEHDLSRTPPSFGEDLAQLQARVTAFWEELIGHIRGETAIVGHRGSLSVLWSVAAAEPLEAVLARNWEPGKAIWMLVT